MAQPIFQANRNVIPDVATPEHWQSDDIVRRTGAAVEQIGAQGEKLSQYYAQDMLTLKGYQANKAVQDFRTTESIRLNQEARTTQDGAPDFTKNFVQKHDENASKVLESIDPQLRPYYSVRLNALKDRVTQAAFQQEVSTRDKYYTENVKDSLNGFLIQLDTNPDQYNDILKNGIDNINSTGLPNETKGEIVKSWKQNAAVAVINRDAANDPERARIGLGGSNRITDPNRLFALNVARGAAGKAGVDPDTLAATMYMENRDMTLGMVHKGGFAKGLFGLDPVSREKFGYEPNLQAETAAGAADAKERTDQFKKDFGRAPQPWEYYVYHWQGVGGGKAVLNADPNESMFDVLSRSNGKAYAAKVMERNPTIQGQTAGEFIDSVKARMNNALNATGGKYDPNMDTADPRYSAIPYDQRLTISSKIAQGQQIQEKAMFAASAREQKDIQDDTYKTASELLSNNKLDQKWLFNNRDNLSAEHYAGLLKIIGKDDEVKTSDFDTRRNLMQWALDPQNAKDVESAAAKAVGDKSLSVADYDRVTKQARKTIGTDDGMSEQDKNRLFTHVQKYMDTVIAPPGFAGRSPITAKQRDEANMNLLQYKFDHPAATMKEFKDFADSEVDRVNKINEVDRSVTKAKQALNIKTIDEATPETMTKTRISLIEAVKNKTLKQADFVTISNGLKEIERRQITAKKGNGQ